MSQPVQRVVANLISLIGVGTGCQKLPDDDQVPPEDRLEKRGVRLGIARVHVGAVFEEKLDHAQLAPVAGLAERVGPFLRWPNRWGEKKESRSSEGITGGLTHATHGWSRSAGAGGLGWLVRLTRLARYEHSSARHHCNKEQECYPAWIFCYVAKGVSFSNFKTTGPGLPHLRVYVNPP